MFYTPYETSIAPNTTLHLWKLVRMNDRERRDALKNNDRRIQRPRARPFADVYRKPKIAVNPMKITNPRQRLTEPKYIPSQQPKNLEDPSKPQRTIQGYDRPERKRPIYHRVPQPPDQGSKQVKKKNTTDSCVLNNEKIIQVFSPLSDKLSSSEDGLLDVNNKMVNTSMETTIGKAQSQRASESTAEPKGKDFLPGIIPYKAPSYCSERRKKFPEQKLSKTTGLNRSNKETKDNTIITPHSLKANQIGVLEAEKETTENLSKDISYDIQTQLIHPHLHGTCGKCLKYCMVISNILILIGSMIVILIAFLSLHDQSFLTQIIGTNLYTNVIYFLIAAACSTVMLSLLGCVGAIKEVRCVLTTYFVALCILFVGIMVGALSGYLFRGHLYNAMEKSMMASLEGYSEDRNTREAWDIIQKYLQCCGVHSVNDWPEEDIPDSCCLTVYMDHPCNKKSSYEAGCLEESYAYIQNNASTIAVAYVLLISVLVLGMVVSYTLWRMVDARKRRFKALSSTQ